MAVVDCGCGRKRSGILKIILSMFNKIGRKRKKMPKKLYFPDCFRIKGVFIDKKPI